MKQIALSIKHYPADYLEDCKLREQRKFEIAGNIAEMKKQIEVIDDLLAGAAMPESMSDTDFLSAEEKLKVLKQWKSFIKSGFLPDRFIRSLYEHLHLHCGYIAHYDRGGYYYTYWNDEILRYAAKNGCALSPVPGVFYEWKRFLKQFTVRGDYRDINTAMMIVLKEKFDSTMEKLLAEVKIMYIYETENAHVLMLKELEFLHKEIQSLEEEKADFKFKLEMLTPESYLTEINSDYTDLFGEESVFSERSKETVLSK